MTGNTYSPRWYLSLDFVPHIVGDRLAYHRTHKSVRPNLVFDMWDHADPSDRAARMPWVVAVTAPTGSVTVAAGNMAKWAVPRADAWFTQASEVGHLPAAVAEAFVLPVRRFGTDDYVEQRLAWAFSLAVAGDRETALQQLDLWLLRAGSGLGDDVATGLRQRLETAGRPERGVGDGRQLQRLCAVTHAR